MNRASSLPVTPPRRRRAFGGALLSLHLLASSAALTAALSAAAQESSPIASVQFVLDHAPPHLDAEKLRAAIGREIGASITLVDRAPSGADALTLQGIGPRQIHLAYRAADGRITERDLD